MTLSQPVFALSPSYCVLSGEATNTYLINQCLSPVMLWVRILLRDRCTTLCDKVCQWLSQGIPVSFINKTDRHDITEILLKVALNTIKPNQTYFILHWFEPTGNWTYDLPHSNWDGRSTNEGLYGVSK